MNARKGLALLAITGSLLGMAACSSDKGADEPYHLTVNGQDRGMVTGDNDPGSAQAAPTNFADNTAQKAVADLCNKLNPQDVAALLGVSAVEFRNGIYEGDGSMSKDHAYCSYMEPGADDYGSTDGDDGQTFLTISIKGSAVKASTGGSGGVVKFADGSTGYYAGVDDTTLLVTPTGSPYEFAFDVSLAYERTTASGLDYETTELFQTKAADAAGGVLN